MTSKDSSRIDSLPGTEAGGPRPSEETVMVGREVAGKYRVERLIARGGMAVVYLARELALNRQVALKVLSPPPVDDRSSFRERFRLEAQTLAAMSHPNIVTLYDYGENADGSCYLAMEYIEGPRLTDLLKGGPMDPKRAVEVVLGVCSALRYAHKRGVVHRDLKPSNLLLQPDPEGGDLVKVVDFGLVKVAEGAQELTREGLILGSPHCMAPEQIRGSENIDARADIYALGIILFRAITGAFPFHGSTSTATMIAHLQEPIPAFVKLVPELMLPEGLEDVVRRCLAKDPEGRYPDARALSSDLRACLGAPSASLSMTRTSELPLPIAVPKAPGRLTVALAAGFFSLFAVALGAWIAGGRSAPVVVPVEIPRAVEVTRAPAEPGMSAGKAPAVEAGGAGGAAPAEGTADGTGPATEAAGGPATEVVGEGGAGGAGAGGAGAEEPEKPAAKPVEKKPVKTTAAKPKTPVKAEKPPEGYMPLPDDFSK